LDWGQQQKEKKIKDLSYLITLGGTLCPLSRSLSPHRVVLLIGCDLSCAKSARFHRITSYEWGTHVAQSIAKRKAGVKVGSLAIFH